MMWLKDCVGSIPALSTKKTEEILFFYFSLCYNYFNDKN